MRATQVLVSLAWIAGGLLTPATLRADEVEEKLRALRVRLTTEHYVFAGTVSDAQFKEYGAALEAMYREFERGFGEVFAPADAPDAGRPGSRADRPADDKSGAGRAGRAGGGSPDEPADVLADEARFRVVLLARKAEYDEFGRIIRVAAESSIGMHVPRYRLLMVHAEGTTERILSTLFHEASHQYLRRYIADPPTWLDEGLADYFGTARPVGKGVRFVNSGRHDWRLLRKAISEKKTVPFHQVLRATKAEFYAAVPVELDDYENVTTRHLHYAQAYSLVHMMMKDRKGRKQLLDYVRALAAEPEAARGEITDKFFSSQFLAKLEPAWVKYVKSYPQ